MHTYIKALSHGAIFLATCNAILLLVDVKLANTRFHHSLLIYSKNITFVTNLHLLRVELRCKLPGNLHRVTAGNRGPAASSFTLVSDWKKPIR